MSAVDLFADLFEANRRYAEADHEVAPSGVARMGMAILTCIDSRIDPLAMFGLVPGDAKILRNAGARVTPDVLRTLALSVAVLGVTRIAVVHHTDCKMEFAAEGALAQAVADAVGRPLPDFDPLVIEDHATTLGHDVQAVLDSPWIVSDTIVAGLLLDLHSGRLDTLVEPVRHP